MIASIVAYLILALMVAGCPISYFLMGPQLTDAQLHVLMVLGIICAASALYCFVVGELSKNNSQMDKLWSILPIAYTWVVAGMGGMSPRLIVMAVLVTLWGIRLTINFARKGAYSIKFWTGEEDYRWKILRDNKMFQPHWKWALFNLFFISIYQNALVLAITFPAVASFGSELPFGWLDFVASGLCAMFLAIELIADEQQRIFQNTKWKMIKEGKKLEELPYPYNKGFNTVGLWNHSRHPNYLGEQGFWLSFCFFSMSAGAGYYNWSFIGAILLVLLFLGSSTLGEMISGSKYPEYAEYRKKVSRFIPWFGYEKKEKEQEA